MMTQHHPRSQLLRIALVTALLLLSTTSGRCDVPEQLELLGRIQDLSGVPPTGPTTFQLFLYPDAVTSTSFAYELRDAYMFEPGGVFRISTAGFSSQIVEDTLLKGGLFLEVRLDFGAALTPRIPLHAALQAVRAQQPIELVAGHSFVGHTGVDTDSGSRLKAAIESGPGTAAANRVVVAGPGRFQIDGTSIVFPDYVTLVGAGRESTRLVLDNLNALTAGERTRLRSLRVDASNLARFMVPAGKGKVLIEDVHVRADVVGVGFLRIKGGSTTVRDSRIEFYPLPNSGSTAEINTTDTAARFLFERTELVASGSSLAFLSALTVATGNEVEIVDSTLRAENLGTGPARAIWYNGSSGDLQALRSRLRATGVDAHAAEVSNSSILRLGANVLEGARTVSGVGTICGARNIAPNLAAVSLAGCPPP